MAYNEVKITNWKIQKNLHFLKNVSLYFSQF